MARTTMTQNGLSKNAQALLAFLSEVLPLYGAINFQANKAQGKPGDAQTLGEGSKERYVWVHQGWGSKRLQGMDKALPSIMSMWSAKFPNVDYIATVKELIAAKQVQERPSKGGYSAALQRDIDEYKKLNGNGASKSALSISDVFEQARRILDHV